MKINHALMACLCAAFVSCSDELPLADMPESLPSEADSYWKTGTRSPEMEAAMLRSHGVGFSFDAVNGTKCNVGDVRCQIVDVDKLDALGAYSEEWKSYTKTNFFTSHNEVEYLQQTGVTMEVSGSMLLYKGSYMSAAAIMEKGKENTVRFTSNYDVQELAKRIDTGVLSDFSTDELTDLLSPNFLYALNKIEATDIDNVAVVDSFINIFGTHVITDALVGGRLTMDIVASKKQFTTYIHEKTVSEQSLNLFFTILEQIVNEENQRFMKGVLNNSELVMTTKGGDVTKLSSIIAAPNPDKIKENTAALSEWEKTVAYSANDPWSSRCEMLDMEVIPIWEFVPNPVTAQRIKTRIQADALTMQQLYGNRNFVSVRIDANPRSVTTSLGGKPVTVNDPWVVDVIAANRKVATVCKEWVPELDPEHSVRVVYPIYENKFQEASGVCIYNGSAYSVRWLYDRFVVEKMDTPVSGNTLYLNCGILSTQPTDGIEYAAGKATLGYEWPGSLDINGNLAGQPYYETRKFLDRFYITTADSYSNLPNWSYCKDDGLSKYMNDEYGDMLRKNDPYALSGIVLNGRGGKANLSNRMVRNDDYTYYINSTEIKYVKRHENK